MDRYYYVEKEHETSETSDRLEAARIAAEWRKRGYVVDTVIVDATDSSVQLSGETDLAADNKHIAAVATASLR
jgi:butyrate kinase